MKKIISLIIIAALVGGAAVGVGGKEAEAATLSPALAMKTAVLQQAIQQAPTLDDVPDCVVNYLANPNDPAAIQEAFDCLSPRLVSAEQVNGPSEDFGAPVGEVTQTGEKVTKAKYFECVFVNNAGAKWNCTVTYQCKDGEICEVLPEIQDHSTGWTLSFSWNASITKDPNNPGKGKLRLNLSWLFLFGSDIACRDVFCACP